MKHHITPAGPMPCSASKRPCPVGGEHFESEEAAWAAYGRQMAGGLIPQGLKKLPGEGEGLESPQEPSAPPAAPRGQWQVYGGAGELAPPAVVAAPPTWEVYSERELTSEAAAGALWEAREAYLRYPGEAETEALEAARREYSALVASPELPFSEAERMAEAVLSKYFEGEESLERVLASRPDAPPGWLSEKLRTLPPPSFDVQQAEEAYAQAQTLLWSPQVATLPEEERLKLFQQLPTAQEEEGALKLGGLASPVRTSHGWDAPTFPAKWAADRFLHGCEPAPARSRWEPAPRKGSVEAVRVGVVEKLVGRDSPLPEVQVALLSPTMLVSATTFQSEGGEWQVELAQNRAGARLQSEGASLKKTSPEVALAAVEEAVRTYQLLEPLARHRDAEVANPKLLQQREALLDACARSLQAALRNLSGEELREARKRAGDRALRRTLKALEAAKEKGSEGELKKHITPSTLAQERSLFEGAPEARGNESTAFTLADGTPTTLRGALREACSTFPCPESPQDVVVYR